MVATVPIVIEFAAIRVDPRDEDKLSAPAQEISGTSNTTRRIPFAPRAVYRYEENEPSHPMIATVSERRGRP
jgi:hypothetical protein